MFEMFRKLLAILLMIVLAGPLVAQSEQTPALRVLIKPVPPFVIDNEGGAIKGFSIDLWQAIEKHLGQKGRFRVLKGVNELLDGIETGQGDVAIAAVTITADRENRLDFSHPYFRSGLQIMVRDGDSGLLARAASVIRGIAASSSFRFALLAIAILVLGTAHIMWLVERRKNPEFTRSYPLGLWDGIYWTMVTISTVGYGDKTPKTQPGKVIALVLIVFGYVAFAWFTATISSAMTVSRLEGEIRGPGDLVEKNVATVRGSTSEIYLEHLPGARIHGVDRIEQAYGLLARGQVDAVVYDFPVLSYYLQAQSDSGLHLTGPVFQRESYGIVFPEGSPLREQVNLALLQLSESGEYDRIYQKWFNMLPE